MITLKFDFSFIEIGNYKRSKGLYREIVDLN